MNAQSSSPPVIDCQVHCYERDRPERPWIGWLHGPPEVTGTDMVAAMDAVGVDGALLISPWSMYRYDPAYALAVYAEHGGRMRLIKPFDPTSVGVAEEIEEWARTPGVVGARIMMASEPNPSADNPGHHRILAAGAATGLPINILGTGYLPEVAKLARANPNTQIVIDHLGLKQPFEPPAPDQPFVDIDNVLALAQCDNVAIKISGACTLAKEPFPYPDIWDSLARIFDAFSLERCLWGTDWTRAVEVLDYAQGVEAFRVTDRLSDTDRATLMGGTLTRIYQWAPR